MPKHSVSVVMACFNAEQTLCRAIESILKQTMSTFQFVIVEDGSTDGTKDILEKYRKKDPRIKLIHNEINIGLAASLNKGILQSAGKYIARMDADDEAIHDRLEKQVSFLSDNTLVDILGSSIQERSDQGELRAIQRLPEIHDEIVKNVFRKPLVFHPTIMAKRSIFEKIAMYNPEITWAEDADLWYRIYDKVVFHNLQEPLLIYTLKEKFTWRHASFNMKVKYKNLRKRGLVLKYLPQLFYDGINLTSKVLIPR